MPDLFFPLGFLAELVAFLGFPDFMPIPWSDSLTRRRCAAHESSIFLGLIDTLPMSVVWWEQEKPPAECGECGEPLARVKMAQNKSSGANLGFETTLWAAADKLRGQPDAAEYKQLVLKA